MFVFYVVNSCRKIVQRLLLGYSWSLFVAFLFYTYSVLISTYSVLISLFQLTFILFTFTLPTSALYIHFEGGKISDNISVEWSLYGTHVYFYRKRLDNLIKVYI